MDINDIITFPLMTESASVMVEKDNKLIFIVNLKAGKTDVKRAVETLYEVKVSKINIAHYSTRRKESVREAKTRIQSFRCCN